MEELSLLLFQQGRKLPTLLLQHTLNTRSWRWRSRRKRKRKRKRFEIEKENHNNNFSEDNEEVDGKEKYLKWERKSQQQYRYSRKLFRGVPGNGKRCVVLLKTIKNKLLMERFFPIIWFVGNYCHDIPYVPRKQNSGRSINRKNIRWCTPKNNVLKARFLAYCRLVRWCWNFIFFPNSMEKNAKRQ